MTVFTVRRAALALLAATLPAALPAQNAQPVPTQIWSDRADIQSTASETTSIFSGHVVAKGTNLVLHCDRLLIVTNRVNDATAAIGQPTAFKSLLATGHVVIEQSEGAREATCGRAQVFPGEDKIVLTEGPVVTDHGNGSVATGDEIDLYRGRRRVEGVHVHVSMPPVKDLGFNRNQEPQTAPSSQ